YVIVRPGDDLCKLLGVRVPGNPFLYLGYTRKVIRKLVVTGWISHTSLSGILLLKYYELLAAYQHKGDKTGIKREADMCREHVPFPRRTRRVYVWVKYARTPALVTVSIRTNPIRSNCTTFPRSPATAGSHTPLSSPSMVSSVQGRVCCAGSHWMMCAFAARASARESPP